jgi:hypothetical protein
MVAISLKLGVYDWPLQSSPYASAVDVSPKKGCLLSQAKRFELRFWGRTVDRSSEMVVTFLEYLHRMNGMGRCNMCRKWDGQISFLRKPSTRHPLPPEKPDTNPDSETAANHLQNATKFGRGSGRR